MRYSRRVSHHDFKTALPCFISNQGLISWDKYLVGRLFLVSLELALGHTVTVTTTCAKWLFTFFSDVYLPSNWTLVQETLWNDSLGPYSESIFSLNTSSSLPSYHHSFPSPLGRALFLFFCLFVCFVVVVVCFWTQSCSLYPLKFFWLTFFL